MIVPGTIRPLLLLVLLPALALLVWALSATVAPDGDSAAGSWSPTPLWSRVDDDIDAPDGVVITSSNNPASPANDVIFGVTCPADVGAITDAELRIRARELGNSGRTITLAMNWSATAATDFSTGALTATLANYSSGLKTGLSVSKSQCDASTLKVAPTTAGGGSPENAEVDSLNLEITYDVATGGRKRRRGVVIGSLLSQPESGSTAHVRTGIAD